MTGVCPEPTGIFADTRLNGIVENPFEGILAIDETGTVIFLNRFFAEVLQSRQENLVGKKVWDIIPGCRLLDTVSQGYSIWGETLRLNGKEFLVARFPLKTGNTIVGAMVKTLFPDQTIAKEIVHKLSHTAKTVQSPQKLCTCRDIIGETPPMLYVKKLARRASRTSSTLLITGESGTGKEIIAQAIHTRSVRREAPFISVNCGAIPENLLESELFGYVDGAFTGAKKGGKPGKFELANGGTVLLDEIGDMPLYMQVKLLRVLQEREVWRIGATAPNKLDVRVMAATNTDLKQLVKEKKFREDLYYRLNVLEIKLPPLRERLEDLPFLVQTLISRINEKIGSDARGVTEESMALLTGYNWPGNVRELENILEQAVNWSEDAIIDVSKIPGGPWRQDTDIPLEANEPEAGGRFRQKVEETEKELILRALQQTNGNKAGAARLLNMQRSVLYKKLKRMNVVI
ncbi:fis bacterial regulatory protein hth signature [Lucifera butyrica]|uniref:Fis bacterial regulatory protein hth signature n=1 Tax=Lucifera butyrica TaxID=1351585 RepID=A0A498REG7_9FIRM|nr:sigma 54-interacting transcriptional regulator [Lucifera butyrica]VBB09881.1 fis bacterial regulatory protein hth signature [Lucifera butyrica]